MLKRSPGAPLPQKDVPASDMWPAMLKIVEDGFPDFVLDWILLNAAALCASYSEQFIMPIEVLQAQIDDLAAAQTVDRE